MTQVYLLPSLRCATLTSVWFQNISITLKKPSYPLSSHFLFSLPSSSWQPLIQFLSLWICLSWTFLTNGLIQYVAFCIQLLQLASCFQGFCCSMDQNFIPPPFFSDIYLAASGLSSGMWFFPCGAQAS